MMTPLTESLRVRHAQMAQAAVFRVEQELAIRLLQVIEWLENRDDGLQMSSMFMSRVGAALDAAVNGMRGEREENLHPQQRERLDELWALMGAWSVLFMGERLPTEKEVV